MKKLVMTCTLLVCLGLISVARAVIVSGFDEWGITLDSGESFTGIAHYVWGSVEFTQTPVQTEGSGYDNGGIWGDIGWQTVLLDEEGTIVDEDGTIACIYGPQSTNNTQNNDFGWFSYYLYYKWDDAVEDPFYPVYIDTAVFDGPFGSEPTNYWGWRGIPGDSNSWEYRDKPYYKDEPEYKEGFYDNPTPELTTIFLFGLGAVFLRRKTRKRR